mgnify:FL=1
MKLLSKIFSLLGLTVSVIVLIVAAAFIAPKFVGIMPYIVKSGSMEPQIHTGAVAFIDTHEKNVAVGDVITYKIGDAGSEKYVTHRIVGEKPDGYVTKGDANEVEDANCVKQEQIVGTYRYSIPHAGRLFAQKSKVTFVAIFWVILLNAMSMIVSAMAGKADEEERGEKESPSNAIHQAEPSAPAEYPGKENNSGTPNA